MEEMMDADLQTLAEQGIQITIEGATGHIDNDDDGQNSDPEDGATAPARAAPTVTSTGGDDSGDNDGGEHVDSSSRFEGGHIEKPNVDHETAESPDPQGRQNSSVDNSVELAAVGDGAGATKDGSSPSPANDRNKGPVAKTSIPQAMFHVFKANVGGGIFLLPTFYNEAGWAVGLCLFTMIGCIVVDCTMMLLHVKNRIGRVDAQTYPTIARFVFGRQMKGFVTFALVMAQFGFCIMYLQYVASLFEEVFDFPYAYQFFVLFGFCIVTPMTFLTHKLHLLALASMFATACVIFVIVSSFLAGAGQLMEHGVGEVHAVRPPLQWVLFLASSVTVLEGIGVILPVENSVKDKERYPGAVKKMMSSIVAAYLIFGIVGQLAFGDKLKSSVVHSMNPGLVATAARLALGVSLWLSYPIQYVPAIQIVDKSVRKRIKSDSPWVPMILRVVLNLFFAAGAFMIGADALALFVAFIGSIAATALCITLPALFTLQVDRALNGDLRAMSRPRYYATVFSAPYTRTRVKCMCYVVLGITVMVVGTLVCLKDAFEMKKAHVGHEATRAPGNVTAQYAASVAQESVENAIESRTLDGRDSYNIDDSRDDSLSSATLERDEEAALGGGNTGGGTVGKHATHPPSKNELPTASPAPHGKSVGFFTNTPQGPKKGIPPP